VRPVGVLPAPPGQNQSLPLRYRYANIPEVLLEALEIMESNMEEPLSPGEIADYLNHSRRQLERLFREHLLTSPAEKYLETRLRACAPIGAAHQPAHRGHCRRLRLRLHGPFHCPLPRGLCQQPAGTAPSGAAQHVAVTADQSCANAIPGVANGKPARWPSP